MKASMEEPEVRTNTRSSNQIPRTRRSIAVDNVDASPISATTNNSNENFVKNAELTITQKGSQNSNLPINSVRGDRKRDPAKHYLHQFRQKDARYRPLYEIFIAYGHEEYFDCTDPATMTELNFASLLANKNRKITKVENQIAEKISKDDAASFQKELEMRL